jgi:hypothetical protein
MLKSTFRQRSQAAFLALAISLPLGGGMARADSAAGNPTASCGQEERWCEHRVATFCKDGTCSSIHNEGQCIPKTQDCGDFWCGNRQCQTSWLLSRDVCCIYYPTANSPEYSCTGSELSCPGNTAQLSIRPPVVALR